MAKIILTGYMGAGKTVVGRLLSEKTGFSFFDLDEMIEKKTQKTISELFLEKGEIGFRKIEHEVLKEFITEQEHYVLSLGGGTPCYANNHIYLQQEDVTSFYLKASVAEISKRIRTEKQQRPLLINLSEDEIEDFVAKHLFDRNYYYHQAKKTITVDGKSPEAIVLEILEVLT